MSAENQPWILQRGLGLDLQTHSSLSIYVGVEPAPTTIRGDGVDAGRLSRVVCDRRGIRRSMGAGTLCRGERLTFVEFESELIVLALHP